ncbi:MAG: hypothetical protein ACLQJR_16365 [Stellaceae bacterium]
MQTLSSFAQTIFRYPSAGEPSRHDLMGDPITSPAPPSWGMQLIIEGFAAYAIAVHPTLQRPLP